MAHAAAEEGGADGDHHYMAMANRAPIATAMAAFVPPDARGLALEIGSGTGAQLQALAAAFPRLSWRPSEFATGGAGVAVRGFYEQGPDGPEAGHPVAKARSLAALDAALADELPNVLPAVDLDGAAPFSSWPPAVTTGEGGASLAGGYELVFASNVVHIAPWAVAEGIFAGASSALRRGGSLVFHGPFKRDGKYEGLGHEQLWDEQMRGFNGEGWGIRDVGEMAAEGARHGLRHAASEHPVGPAKNFMLHFVKE